ncbi:MAG TPA: DMT family transporter [Virgibacillus sp.]|nr:DMT family transporter [Virgibacillus sp.]
MKSEQSVAIYFWLLLAPLFWGGAFVAAEHVITEVPPITAAALRFGVAGLILLILVVWRGQVNFNGIMKQWVPLFLMALTGIFGYNLFFFIGLDMTSAINGSLIMATSPVFMTIGAVLFLHEEWNKRVGLGLILSLLGVLVVISQGSLATIVQLDFNRGDLLFIGGLICWVSHGLLGKMVMREVSPLITTTVTTIIGSILLVVTSVIENGWQTVPQMSLQGWGEMLFMVICSSVIAFLVWNQGIQQVGASKASIYMNLVPVSTALIAVFIYGSVITVTQMLGMLIVIIGIYVVTIHPYVSKWVDKQTIL